jgi:hypothetical protein
LALLSTRSSMSSWRRATCSKSTRRASLLRYLARHYPKL